MTEMAGAAQAAAAVRRNREQQEKEERDKQAPPAGKERHHSSHDRHLQDDSHHHGSKHQLRESHSDDKFLASKEKLDRHQSDKYLSDSCADKSKAKTLTEEEQLRREEEKKHNVEKKQGSRTQVPSSSCESSTSRLHVYAKAGPSSSPSETPSEPQKSVKWTTMATNGGVSDDGLIPIEMADESFMDEQKLRWKEIKKSLERESRRKKREWEKEVDKMRTEFITLNPVDVNESPRKVQQNNIEVLDTSKMRTVLVESPYSGCKYKLRFDMGGYDKESIQVQVDDEVICVRAWRDEEDDKGVSVRREYCRKLEKPPEMDNKVTCCLTNDQVLILEAALPPQSLKITNKVMPSPSHSHNSASSDCASPSHTNATSHPSSAHPSSHYLSHQSHASLSRSRSSSNNSSSTTPTSWMGIKPNTPVFMGPNRERRMYMYVDICNYFRAPDITVHVLKDTCITVKARQKEKSTDKLNMFKFTKPFELSERIDPFSLRAGLTAEGRLLIAALGKSHVAKDEGGKMIWDEVNAKATPCAVLDLSTFPPCNTPTK